MFIFDLAEHFDNFPKYFLWLLFGNNNQLHEITRIILMMEFLQFLHYINIIFPRLIVQSV